MAGMVKKTCSPPRAFVVGTRDLSAAADLSRRGPRRSRDTLFSPPVASGGRRPASHERPPAPFPPLRMGGRGRGGRSPGERMPSPRTTIAQIAVATDSATCKAVTRLACRLP